MSGTRRLLASMLVLLAVALQGAVPCAMSHARAAPVVGEHCAGMADGGHMSASHEQDQDQSQALHDCAHACHPSVVFACPDPLKVIAGQDSAPQALMLEQYSGTSPPPATPPPRRACSRT